MKHVIALLFFVAAFIVVIYGGMWYVNENNKQYLYDQIKGITNNDNGLVPDSDVQVSGTDPFGLFGPDEMTYEVTITSDWNSRNHAGYYPNTANLSQPVFWTGKTNPVFDINSTASEGMVEFSQSGRTRALKQELDKLLETNAISQYDIKNRIDAPGSDSFTIVMTRENNILSIVSKITPSPDWFVALEGINMIEDGRWKDNVRVSMVALDAGVVSGSGFNQSGSATVPIGTIGSLQDIPSVSLPPFANVTLRQIIK